MAGGRERAVGRGRRWEWYESGSRGGELGEAAGWWEPKRAMIGAEEGQGRGGPTAKNGGGRM